MFIRSLLLTYLLGVIFGLDVIERRGLKLNLREKTVRTDDEEIELSCSINAD